MAQRRMFSPDIVCSDAFMEMPTSSRELYFQLGMKADDDGFVNPRGIMRYTGSSEDDLKVLIGKRFVLPFDNGVIVIKHWKVNNLVRKDWYRPSINTEERKTLYVKENGSYTLDSTKGKKLVNKSLTVRPRSIGKVRIGNLPALPAGTHIEEETPKDKKNSPEMLLGYGVFKDNPAWVTFKMLILERESMKAIIKDFGLPELTRLYAIVKKHRDEEFCPNINSPSTFLRKFAQMEKFMKNLQRV